MNRNSLLRLLPARLRKPPAQADILDGLPDLDLGVTAQPPVATNEEVAATESTAPPSPAKSKGLFQRQRPKPTPQSPAAGGVEDRPSKRRKTKPADSHARSEHQRSGDYQVLAHPSALDGVTHRKVLVCGDCIMATLDSSALAAAVDPQGQVGRMIPQAPRVTAPALKGMFGARGKPLLFAVDHRLFDRQRTRFAFAIDGYVSWGLRHGRGTTVLLGGAQDGGNTYLDVLVFQDNVLVEVQSNELPSHLDARFSAFLATLLDSLTERYAQPRIVAASPLPDWGHPGVEYLGLAPLRGLRFAPLSVKVSSVAGAKSAAIVASVGVAVYAGFLGVGWNMYTGAVKSYEMEAADPQLQESGGISNSALEEMQQQRLFMEAARPQELLTQRSRRIVSAVASVPGVKINSLTFHAGASGNEPGQFGAPAGPVSEAPASSDAGAAGDAASSPDVSMVIVVPSTGAYALDQAKAVMQQVGSASGMALRLAPGGASEDDAAGTRTFTIQGMIK